MNRKQERNPLEAIKEISRRVSQNKTENLSQNKKKSSDGKKAPSKKDVLKPVEEKKKTGKPDPETKAAGKKLQEKNTSEKEQQEKKASGKKQQEKKAPEKKLQEKKAQEKKPQEKKAPEKKLQEKKAQEKKPQEKKAPEKKQQEKKASEKKLQDNGITAEKTAEKKPAEKKTPEKKDSEKGKKSGKKTAEKTVRIIPLGGLEQIGLNITAFEYDNSIFVVDCGIAFPTDEMPGIDLVIPDVTYLKENFSKVKGFVITHGHEDHIGALPYILKEVNVPVYGTKLTMALIEHKLEESGMLESAKLRTVSHGQSIKLGDFKIEFVKTNHSIQDACALAIYSPAGIIFHTGDFKIDYTPVFGEPADIARMAEIGKEGCLALMCDSTNANKSGWTPSEKNVGRVFDTIFSEHMGQRIIIASFASNVDRVQQAINTAYKYDRKVVIEGRSMANIIEVADALGNLHVPEGVIIDISQLKNYAPERTVIITTGSQGESMAALSRMAMGTHKKVSITSSDVVIMSSKPIPGNEKAVSKVINELFMKGAKVILHDTHVSGHACVEDLKLIYALLKPKFVLPVHGEYMHLVAQKEIAVSMGVPEENVVIMSSGDVLSLSSKECKVRERVDAGYIMVDGLGVGDVGSVVLKDRQILAQNGILVISMAVNPLTNELLSGPEIVSRGFVFEKENEKLFEEAKTKAGEKLDELLHGDFVDWPKVKTEVKDAVRSYLWREMKKAPVIIPVIMQVYA